MRHRGAVPGPFALQAAIAAEHCKAGHADRYPLATNRPALRSSRTRAAVSHRVAESGGGGRDGGRPRPALALIDALAATGELDEYHLLHAARADLLRRMGSTVEAAKSYERALALVTNESERRFLERRLREVQPPAAVTLYRDASRRQVTVNSPVPDKVRGCFLPGH